MLTDTEAVKAATKAARNRARRQGIGRKFPEFRPLMSTTQYVQEYEAANVGLNLTPWAGHLPATCLRRAPQIVGPEVVAEEQIDPHDIA